MPTSTEKELRDRFEAAGQGQVFRFWSQLDESEQAILASQAASIDLDEIASLVTQSSKAAAAIDLNSLEPAPVLPLPSRGGDAALWERARAAGEEALRAGRVAAFTVAGGQGTRLGFAGPKGTFPVTPVLEKPLFQVFAEKILAASHRYGVVLPWYVMTSAVNHADTVAFFETHQHFGLQTDQVRFFQQGLMPAVDQAGKIILSGKGTIAMSPDGHGGSLRALVRSGSIERMREAGIDILSYFQVDNPLVRAIDPVFIGHHVLASSELSSKAVPKASAEEKVGVFCKADGRISVVEYSDLPDELSRKTDAEGALTFNAGSIAIHLFDRELIARLGDPASEVQLPFHFASKKIPTLDADGQPLSPGEPNGTKFETFVFDALPFARNPIVIETAREDDFSPVKNAEGADSPLTSRHDQLRQFARWFAAAGVALACDDTGLPEISIEISPLFADSEESFLEAWAALEVKPELTGSIVLS